MKFFFPLIISSMFLMPASLLAAAMDLQKDQSFISFVSVKNNTVGEAHTFDGISGSIKDNQAEVIIQAESVKTNIDIRDKRMKEFLFKAAEHAQITITADVSTALDSLKDTSTKQATVPAKLNLMGVEKDVELDVMVSKSKNASITVTSIKPVIISADDYGLGTGIDKLAELAGGISIVKSVPVSFGLTFK